MSRKSQRRHRYCNVAWSRWPRPGQNGRGWPRWPLSRWCRPARMPGVPTVTGSTRARAAARAAGSGSLGSGASTAVSRSGSPATASLCTEPGCMWPRSATVRVRWSRALPSVPSSVTVIREPDGRFYASFVVERDPTDAAAGGAYCRDRPRPGLRWRQSSAVTARSSRLPTRGMRSRKVRDRQAAGWAILVPWRRRPAQRVGGRETAPVKQEPTPRRRMSGAAPRRVASATFKRRRRAVGQKRPVHHRIGGRVT